MFGRFHRGDPLQRLQPLGPSRRLWVNMNQSILGAMRSLKESDVFAICESGSGLDHFGSLI